MASADQSHRVPRPAGDTGEKADLAQSTSRQGSPGEPEPSDRQGEGIRGYGRQGGSIADTGTRTDVPVGVEQVESSIRHTPDEARQSERQGNPPPPGDPADRGL